MSFKWVSYIASLLPMSLCGVWCPYSLIFFFISTLLQKKIEDFISYLFFNFLDIWESFDLLLYILDDPCPGPSLYLFFHLFL